MRFTTLSQEYELQVLKPNGFSICFKFTITNAFHFKGGVWFSKIKEKQTSGVFFLSECYFYLMPSGEK